MPLRLVFGRAHTALPQLSFCLLPLFSRAVTPSEIPDGVTETAWTTDFSLSYYPELCVPLVEHFSIGVLLIPPGLTGDLSYLYSPFPTAPVLIVQGPLVPCVLKSSSFFFINPLQK